MRFNVFFTYRTRKTTTLVTYTIYSVISCLYCYKKHYAILIPQENSIKTVSTEKAASVKIGGRVFKQT